MMHRWMMVACALALAGCQPDTCSDVECMMNHFHLTAEDGSPVPLTEVPGTMVWLPPDDAPDSSASPDSFTLVIVPVSAPNFGDPLEMVENGIPIYSGSGTSDASIAPTITNQPAAITFLGTDSVRTIELDYDDPNGESPGFYWVAKDPKTGRMYPHCVWMEPSERDMIRRGSKKLKANVDGYIDFTVSGFYEANCNRLPPFRPPTTPPGGVVGRCPQNYFVCGAGCLPNGATCGPGDGEAGCSPGLHLCPGNVCTAKPCCDYFSPDLGCCPNGPMAPPCLPPNVAGNPVQIPVTPTAPPAGGGGGGGTSGGGGGGGGGTEYWIITDPGGGQARVSITADGTIASSGSPQWMMYNNAHDCSFSLPISGKLSGTSFTFSVMGSGCGSYTLTGNGSGTANGTFGVATQATGTLHETANSPLGPVSNDGTFTAVRSQ